MMSEEGKTAKTEDGRKRIPTVLKFALILVGAFVASNVVNSFFDSGGSENASLASDVGWLEVVPAIVVSVFLVLVLHEVGHLIGGKVSGMRFMLFVVGPLRLQATSNGIKAHLNRSLAMAGGLGGTAPTDATDLRRRMALMTAGGPVMSFVVAGAAYILGTFVTDGFISVLFVAITLMSVMIGAVTILPMRSGGFMSDGARLVMLYRNGPEAVRWCALSAVGGASTFGERPREWDESLIEESLSPADGSLDDVGASLNAAHHALDLGRPDRAKSLLERAMEATDVPGFLRSQALLENAFFRAYFEGDATGSRKLFSEVPSGSTFEKHLELRAEAAVLLAEGKVEKAREKAREALKDLSGSMSPGTARLEREWLEDLEDGRSPSLSSEVGAPRGGLQVRREDTND